jgi:hypothetical protein
MLHANTPSPECVDAAPTTRDVEQFEMADAFRKRWINNEMVAQWFKAKHCPKQKQWSASRPCLRTACGRILDRIFC